MVLVLGRYVSPEDRRRLQQLRAASQPAPRYVPQLSRGYGPGGGSGRSDVSPSEGSALMLDKYGHLLPPRDELLNDDRSPEDIREERAYLRQHNPDFGGMGGEAVLSDAHVNHRAQIIIENYVLGHEPANMTEMSEVDIARVQEAIDGKLQEPTNYEIEEAARRVAEHSSHEQTVIDQLYQEEPGFGYEMDGGYTYHLESEALVETRPDGSQLVFAEADVEAVQERAVEMRQEWAKEQQQQQLSTPTPSKGRGEPEMSKTSRDQITAKFAQFLAEKKQEWAPAHEYRAKRSAEREARASGKGDKPAVTGVLSPSQLAQRAEEVMKLNADRGQSESTLTTTLDDPMAIRKEKTEPGVEVKVQQPTTEMEPSKPLSSTQHAAERGAASMQQYEERSRPPTLVEYLGSKPEGHIAIHPKTGAAFRLVADEVHEVKDGKSTGWTMKADELHKYELNARQDKQASATQQTRSSDKQQSTDVQKSQSKIAQAGHAQSGNVTSTKERADQAEALMKANAERIALPKAQQKDRGQDLN